MHRYFPGLALFLALTMAAPAFAYTIVLTDGSKVEAREKYRVEDGKALIYLINGTLVTYELAKIDQKRTDAANTSNFGTAILFEDGKARRGPPPPAPPRGDTLSELIKKRQADLRAPEQSRRSEPLPSRRARLGGPPALAELESFGDLELVGALQQYFRSQGVETVGVYQGSSSTRPLIIANTNSEGSVFRALTVAANALLEMRARHGDSLPGLELRLEASGRSNAGEFTIDPDRAYELTDGKIEVAGFFVKYVEF